MAAKQLESLEKRFTTTQRNHRGTFSPLQTRGYDEDGARDHRDPRGLHRSCDHGQFEGRRAEQDGGSCQR